METIYDVIIIGAGPAGLACAKELQQKGLHFLVLEARSRIGGRAFTLHPAESEVPVELGAEFIHGCPPSTLEFMASLKLPFFDVTDEHLFLHNGKLHSLPEFFDKLDKLGKRINPRKKADDSMMSFLEKLKNVDTETKGLFISFIEGFHAADPSLIGEKGFTSAQVKNENSLNGNQMFRPLQGYDRLMSGLASFFSPEKNLRLNTVVEKISWRQGAVTLSCRALASDKVLFMKSRKLVITAPLGVLKSGNLEWDPMPAVLPGILNGLEMGHVQRLAFQFRHRFWEDLQKDRPVSFLHASPENYFSTWWTSMPVRSGQLIAWQGGPKALEMAGWSERKRIRTALGTLAKLLGRSVGTLSNEMVFCKTHNWSQDPFAFGAYSFVGVEGMKAAKRFSSPVKSTLYFAGEATITNADRGTISGAFESGLRAAEQVFSSKNL